MLKKVLLFLHKWLGIVLALLFLMWFASGLVLHYVPFPSLTPSERLNGLPALRLSAECCLTAQEAARRARLTFTDARLGMHAAGPVWRLLAMGADEDGGAQPRWQVLDARSGALIPALSEAEMGAVAGAFSGQRVLRAEQVEADQWSTALSLNPYRPLLRMTMDGPEGLELYASPSTGEVLRDTRRMERFWNWLGAVPHWFYFDQLRQWTDLRKNLVICLSSLGVLMALSGLVLGIWQLFLNPARRIPYRSFWPRWHHIGGLAAGLIAFTWILSGLLSVNPWGLFGSRAAPAAERARWLGEPSPATLNPASALAEALAAFPVLQPREIDMLRVAGQAWYRVRGAGGQMLVRADAGPSGALPALPDATIRSTLRDLRQDLAASGGDGFPVLSKLETYDDLYYSREYEAQSNKKFSRPLPVWRARWADGLTLYADPASGRVLLRQDDTNRWQRVLYNGMHSFDFAFLMARPWLRSGLIVLLSLLGFALSATACVMAWRALVPPARQWRARP